MEPELEPEAIWRHFKEICKIPRPSKHEGKILSYLRKFGEDRQLIVSQDRATNMLIKRPGSNGGEKAQPILIQCHVDMVTAKNSGKSHDFFSDPIVLVQDGEWIGASGTTLGADNGIGVSTALALLEAPSSAVLPPLECLFTVDEETGLTGAKGLNPCELGVTATTLLNLDTEEWGVIYIGCAGAGDSVITCPVSRENVERNTSGRIAMNISISGLLGGHSGINIHECRGNALQLLAGVCQRLIRLHPSKISLVDFLGGEKRNNIPREAVATIVITELDVGEVERFVGEEFKNMFLEFGDLESNLALSTTRAHTDPTDEAPGLAPLGAESAERLLSLLRLLPHGDVKKSFTVKDPHGEALVETSSNLGAITREPADDNVYTVVCSTRSSVAHALEEVRDRIRLVGNLIGAGVQQPPPYPGWAPNMRSPILGVVTKCLANILGKEPQIAAVHAGLECGLFQEMMPGLDAVSFGPTIRGAHSPDERVLVPTVKPFFDLVCDVLACLCREPSSAGAGAGAGVGDAAEDAEDALLASSLSQCFCGAVGSLPPAGLGCASAVCACRR